MAAVAAPSIPTVRVEELPGAAIVGMGVADKVDIGLAVAVGSGVRARIGVGVDDGVAVGVSENANVGVADGVADWLTCDPCAWTVND